MQITEKHENGVVVLTLKSNLLTEPVITEVREQIAKLASDNMKHVILDMSEVKYMNSLGIGALVSALTTLRRAGGDLRLVCLSDKVKNSFTLTQLVRVFNTFDSLEEALASYKRS